MKYAYSPHTGEIIHTTDIAAWMGVTEITPPDFDRSTESAVFNGSGWDVVQATIEIIVPDVVSRAQGKASLIQAGLWPSVVDYVAGIADQTEQLLAETALYDTQEWRRDSPFLNAAALALGLTKEQLDQLFIAAAQIQL